MRPFGSLRWHIRVAILITRNVSVSQHKVYSSWTRLRVSAVNNHQQAYSTRPKQGVNYNCNYVRDLILYNINPYRTNVENRVSS